MKRAIVLWTVAVVVTLGTAVYQRITGPTYPLRGSFTWAGVEDGFRLPRSHAGATDCPVRLKMDKMDVTRPDVRASLIYRRYKTNDEWRRIPMSLEQKVWAAALPHQPPAGKLEYFILLEKDNTRMSVPADRTVVVRFKGAVPGLFLVPHILFMFLAMLLANRTALEAVLNGKRLFRLVVWTSASLLLGGMLLGPIVQKYAFGEFWTGFPFGTDLTDNKVLLAVIAWGAALWRSSRKEGRDGRWWALFAALVLLVIYSIPHSVLGSELDYQTMQVITGD